MGIVMLAWFAFLFLVCGVAGAWALSEPRGEAPHQTISANDQTPEPAQIETPNPDANNKVGDMIAKWLVKKMKQLKQWADDFALPIGNGCYIKP